MSPAPTARSLAEAARRSFISGMDLGLLVAGVVVGIAGCLVWVLLPNRGTRYRPPSSEDRSLVSGTSRRFARPSGGTAATWSPDRVALASGHAVEGGARLDARGRSRAPHRVVGTGRSGERSAGNTVGTSLRRDEDRGSHFPPGGSTPTCTASVVDSARATSCHRAHCIWGTGAGFAFVPEYRDGSRPFGTWKVIGAYGDAGWIGTQDPEDDVAFLVVSKNSVKGHAASIQSVVGGNRLGAAPVPGSQVTVPAYAAIRLERPITCTVRVYDDATYPAFNCNAYGIGTSGAPWLALPATGGRSSA